MENLLKNKLDIQYSNFMHFPDFAKFILQDHLDDFVHDQLAFSKEEQIPLLRFFKDLSEEEFFEMSKESSVELLTAIVENNLAAYIQSAVESYTNNIIPLLQNESILAEDITLVSLVRRKAFGKMLLRYTDQTVEYAMVTEEIDRYLAVSEMASFNAFISIQEDKLAVINRSLVQRQKDLYEAEELANMGSFVWNIKNKTSSYTPGVNRLFQETKNGSLVDFLSHVHEEDLHKVNEALNDSYENGGYYECEYRFHIHGAVKYIWTRAKVDFDVDGKPEFMRGTIMDVTEQHQLIQQLQDSETLNKHVQAITHVGNWTWDIGEDKVSWSDEMYRIYGLAPQSEEISLARFLAFVHPEDRDQRLFDIQESIRTLQVKDYVIRIISEDGEIKVLRGKGELITNAKNEAVKLLGSCQDVTGEYNLTSELEEKEKNLSQLINNAPDGVLVFDEEGTITLYNPKCERLFGKKSLLKNGRNILDLFPNRFQKNYDDLIKKLINGEKPGFANSSLELTAINDDGGEFTISLTISSSEETRNRTFIAFLRDISVEKEIKEDLNKKTALLEKLNLSLASKNSKLEQVNKELNSFNYIASHDLQEPIRKIKIFAGRILECEESSLSSSAHIYLSKVVESSTRMKVLIQDLLTFSQATGLEDKFQDVDLNLVMEGVKSSLSNLIEEKNVIIECNNLPTIQGIQFQMGQLFSNLLSNSIKYCTSTVAPKINISWKLDSSENIPYQEAQPEMTYIHIIIKDNGIGFETQYCEKIFDLFQRLHEKNEFSGTGIGLAICKKVVLNHHGFIKAESVLGNGSTFRIYIPIGV